MPTAVSIRRFGSRGKVAIGGPQFMLCDVALQSDGRIVAAGADVIIIAPDPEGGFIERQVFAVARFNANGSVDSTFGEGGRVLTDAGRTFAGPRAWWFSRMTGSWPLDRSTTISAS
jgi:hypothetical protein